MSAGASKVIMDIKHRVEHLCDFLSLSGWRNTFALHRRAPGPIPGTASGGAVVFRRLLSLTGSATALDWAAASSGTPTTAHSLCRSHLISRTGASATSTSSLLPRRRLHHSSYRGCRRFARPLCISREPLSDTVHLPLWHTHNCPVAGPLQEIFIPNE
jgi:hypothetical protein